MSNILNLVNQKAVVLASLGACATVAAYCVYSKRSWTSSKLENSGQSSGSNAVSATLGSAPGNSSPNLLEPSSAAATAAEHGGGAPQLTPKFVAARLRALSNAPDSSLYLVEGDSDALSMRLQLLSNEGDSKSLIACLQLTGRLLLLDKHASDVLQRSSQLRATLSELYTSQTDVEVRVRCLLALGSFAHDSLGDSDTEAVRRLADRLVSDALESHRLRPHALRLLRQLGAPGRREFASRSPQLTSTLVGLLAASTAIDLGCGGSPAAGSFGQVAAALTAMLADKACRRAALASRVPPGATAFGGMRRLGNGGFVEALKRDVGVRSAWLEFLSCLASNTCQADLTTVWWNLGTLAADFRANLPQLYKQIKKLSKSLTSSDRKSQQGQRLLAVKKELKALKSLAKQKPRK